MKTNKWNRGILVLLVGVGVLAAPALRAGSLETDDLTVKGTARFHGDIDLAPLPPFTNAILLYYSFDTTANPVPDDSGLGHAGALYDALWTAEGKYDGAYVFVDDDDQIQIPSLGAIENYSISVWFKRNDLTSRGGFYENWSWDPFRIMLFAMQNYSFRIQFFIYTDLDNFRYVYCEPTGIYDDTEWHHVVATRAGSELKIYVDGVDRTIFSTGGGDPSGPIDTGLDPVIGNTPGWSLSTHEFTLDDYRIYTTALSAQDVIALYSNNLVLVADRAGGRINGDVTVSNLTIKGAIVAEQPAVTADGLVRKGEVDSAITEQVAALFPELRQDPLTLAVTENFSCMANGFSAHAEGSSSAYGDYSHSEGLATEAAATAAHAEGWSTAARGSFSHAGGQWSAAEHENSFIHATGPIGSPKTTLFPDTGHFDRLLTFEPANDHSNSVLNRAESDNRYVRQDYVAPRGDVGMGIYTNEP